MQVRVLSVAMLVVRCFFEQYFVHIPLQQQIAVV
jgi:hypothetical protein